MASPDSIRNLTVQASTAHLSKVRRFVAQEARLFGFDKQQISDIQLAVDEAFTNIIKHAYKNNASKEVKISLHNGDDTFWISLVDTGRSFSLEEYEKPDIRRRIKQKKRGGVGVYLIQKLMDEVTYQHNGKVNKICMLKKR